MSDDGSDMRELVASARSMQPRLRSAIRGDAEMTCAYRGERHRFRSPLDAAVQVVRLCVVADAFAAQVFYRLRCSLRRRRVPLLPHLLHRLSMMTAGVCIGDPVVIEPGLYLAHGNVVIDGIVRIERGAVIFPFVTIGLAPPALLGPRIDANVHVGTGAKVLGDVHLGAGAKVGANAVVLDDVPAGRTAVGAPARPIEPRP